MQVPEKLEVLIFTCIFKFIGSLYDSFKLLICLVTNLQNCEQVNLRLCRQKVKICSSLLQCILK